MEILTWMEAKATYNGYLGITNSPPCTQINITERSLLEKINTLLLESCIMSSDFELTISDCRDASILQTLCPCKVKMKNLEVPTENHSQYV